MLSQGTQLGPYEVQSLLGAGGMGEVYRARDTRLNRTVALKILPPQVAADPSRRGRFEQEARAASALNHPNILSVFDIGEQDGLAYIVSELIEGESLREMLRRGPLPLSRVLDISCQVAAALAAAHSAYIVHRDIKPENIMITRDGRAKILDFGLAKQVSAAGPDDTRTVTHTSPGSVIGTAAYMSPEQIRGEPVDYRSDIFSFGLVLYECVTAKPPFDRPTSVEVMTAILREDPAELPENVSPALRQIIWHCLEKEPDHRFHSLRDLAFALRTVSAAPSRTSVSGILPPLAAPHGGRWVWTVLAGGLGMLLLAVALLFFLEWEPLDLAQYRLTPFATNQDPETDGSWSPDGKSIAYLQTIAGTPQLMVRELAASSAVQLTKSPAPVTQAFWSPASSLLYYLIDADGGEIWAISPAGGHPSRILAGGMSSASLSPDGQTLAIWQAQSVGARMRASVQISSPPGAKPVDYKLAPFGKAEISPGNRIAFSPDGHSILLTIGNHSSEIWLLPYPAGAAPRRLFAETDLGMGARSSWLPDSRHAVLSLAPGLATAPALWLADLKSERLRKITAATLGWAEPSIAPDGSSLVFTAIEDDFDLVQLPLTGGPPTILGANSRNELSPSWSPDGDQIVYSDDRTGQREIWMHGMKGLDRPVVTPADFPPGTTIALVDPVFSPGGDRFAFVRYSTGGMVTIWVEPTVGGAPVRLTHERIESPAWSPDGNSIAGLVQRESPSQPAIVGVGADMSAHVIPNSPICWTSLDWSPTGEWLACDTPFGVTLFAPDGAKSKLLHTAHPAAVAFSRDGKTLFTAGTEHGRAFLKSIDISTGAVHDLADYGSGLTISGGQLFHTRLSVAPDGKSVATSAVRKKSDLWLLSGFPTGRPWWRFWR